MEKEKRAKLPKIFKAIMTGRLAAAAAMLGAEDGLAAEVLDGRTVLGFALEFHSNDAKMERFAAEALSHGADPGEIYRSSSGGTWCGVLSEEIAKAAVARGAASCAEVLMLQCLGKPGGVAAVNGMSHKLAAELLRNDPGEGAVTICRLAAENLKLGLPRVTESKARELKAGLAALDAVLAERDVRLESEPSETALPGMKRKGCGSL